MQIILIEREPKAMNKIYISDRGKQHKHINNFLKRSRLPHERRHLEYGDYQIEGKPIVIFVFESIQEFAAAVRDKKKDHFWKQVSRAAGGDKQHLFCLINGGRAEKIIFREAEGERIRSDIETIKKYPNTHVLFLDERDIAQTVAVILHAWLDIDPLATAISYGKDIEKILKIKAPKDKIKDKKIIQ